MMHGRRRNLKSAKLRKNSNFALTNDKDQLTYTKWPPTTLAAKPPNFK